MNKWFNSDFIHSFFTFSPSLANKGFVGCIEITVICIVYKFVLLKRILLGMWQRWNLNTSRLERWIQFDHSVNLLVQLAPHFSSPPIQWCRSVVIAVAHSLWLYHSIIWNLPVLNTGKKERVQHPTNNVIHILSFSWRYQWYYISDKNLSNQYHIKF